MDKNTIKSFCIGDWQGNAIFTKDEKEFFQYIKEKIEEAKENGQKRFDITIEQTEC